MQERKKKQTTSSAEEEIKSKILFHSKEDKRYAV
jgi:hypothetical protein